jgi:hypothetical protein
MVMISLDFTNGFWIPHNWSDSTNVMWKNFATYCKSKGAFNEVVLLTEFNAKAQRYAGDDDDDDQWFVRFNTPEDYTFFVMRFA